MEAVDSGGAGGGEDEEGGYRARGSLGIVNDGAAIDSAKKLAGVGVEFEEGESLFRLVT